MKIEELISIYKTNPLLVFKRSLPNKEFHDIINSATGFLCWHYTNVKFKQRMWHIVNNKSILIMCPYCKVKTAKWTNRWGYITCSNSCSKKLIKEKSSYALLKKYGVPLHLIPNNLEKTQNTSLERYGQDHYSKTEEFKSRNKETCLKNLGVTHNSKSPQVQASYNKFWATKFADKLPKEYELLLFSDPLLLKCCSCGVNFNISKGLFETRIKADHVLCTKCNPVAFGTSHKEKEIYRFVCSQFEGVVQNNIRGIIPPFELDVFIPKLSLAVEFNGTYSHADTRKFNASSLIWGRPAHELWARDERKIKECLKNNIKLLIIKEIDWDTSKPTQKDLICDSIHKSQESTFL